MPVAEALEQASPFAAMFSNVQDSVDHLQVAQADVAALSGPAMLSLGELLCRDFYACSLPTTNSLVNSVNTP